MKIADQDFTLMFLHIPKTGGSTLSNILRRQYAENEIFRINGGPDLEHFNSMENLAKSKFRLVTGHFLIGFERSFPYKHKIISLLRNPVDRIISHYRYVKRTRGHYLYKKINEQHISLLDYALSDLTPELDNAYIRHLSGISFGINCCTKSILDSAIVNLSTKLVTFGISERFDESLLLFKEDLGWPIVPSGPSLNVSPELQIPIEHEIREAIADRNKYDVQLYDWATRLFDNKLRKIDVQI